MNNMKESKYIGGREVGDAENVETLSVRDVKNEKSGL
jgi:POT family proton-dependent oligopeptide transporter